MKLSILSVLIILLNSLQQGVYAYDSDNCIEDFTQLATYTNIVEKPEDFLIDLTSEVCVPMLSNAENGFKTFVCSYTTIFTVEQMQNLVEQGGLDDGTVDLYISDYCSNIQNATQEKIFIIDKLSELDPYSSDEQFDDNCIDQLLSYPNYWYDPLIPSQAITYGDMCDVFQELFQQLEMKDVTSFEDAVIYSYVLVYQMYLNSQEEQAYAKCIDSHLAFQSQSYCESSLAGNLNFTLWVESSSQTECAYAISSFESTCGDMDATNYDEDIDSTTNSTLDADLSESSSSNQTQLYVNQTEEEMQLAICDQPCAYVLSYLVSSYETYITSCLEVVFQTVNEQSSYALQEGLTSSWEFSEENLESLNDPVQSMPDISSLTTTTSTPTSN